MEAFITYIFKIAICTGTFLAVYVLFLRRTTFFGFNRFFLLSGLIASLIFPFINFKYDVILPLQSISTNINPLSEKVLTTNSASFSLDFWMILFGIYIVGFFLLVIKNMLSYSSLSKYILSGEKTKKGKYNIIENNRVKSPFTVLNYILINTHTLSNIEKDLILKHEITHIRQKHWIDLICSECMLMLQWFNPLIWIYVRFLKENHEFLADKSVIDSGISPAVYQAVLINQEFQGPVFSFSNSFIYSKPLNRLKMIKKTKSASWKRLAALTIIPLSGLFFWASATPNYIFDYAPIDKSNVKSSKDSVRVNLTVFSSGGEDTVHKGVLVYADKDAIMDENVKVIGDGKLNGKIVSITDNRVIENNDTVKIRVNTLHTKEGKDPLIVLDGKKLTDRDMSKINPESIDNISVIKDKTSVELYGEDGKNGVIIIQTKEYMKNNPDKAPQRNDGKVIGYGTSREKSTSRMINKIMPDGKEPLLIVDGKEKPLSYLDNMNASEIESMSVLKDEESTKKYGEKAKDGVIIIETKKK